MALVGEEEGNQGTDMSNIPPVEVGQTVWYYRDAQVHDKPYPAKVVRVNHETLDLTITQKDSMNVHPQSGVRHASDPRLALPEISKLGCWDLTTRDKKINKLLEDLGDK